MPRERGSGKPKKKARKAKKPAAPDEEVRSAADVASERAAAMAEQAAAEEPEPVGEAEAATPEKPAEEAVEEAAPDEEGAEAPPEPGAAEVPEITVAALLRGTVELLAVQAWQHLGIQVSPQTGELRKDVPQARLAIDAASAILEKLQPHLTEDERQQFEALLANLRINYVQRSDE